MPKLCQQQLNLVGWTLAFVIFAPIAWGKEVLLQKVDKSVCDRVTWIPYKIEGYIKPIVKQASARKSNITQPKQPK